MRCINELANMCLKSYIPARLELHPEKGGEKKEEKMGRGEEGGRKESKAGINAGTCCIISERSSI